MSTERKVSPEDWIRFAIMAPPLGTADALALALQRGATAETFQAHHVADFADRLARLFLDRYPEEGRS